MNQVEVFVKRVEVFVNRVEADGSVCESGGSGRVELKKSRELKNLHIHFIAILPSFH